MVNDELGLLFRAADLNAAANGFNTNGNDLNIGRAGLNSRSTITTYVEKADDDRALTFSIYLSLNNDTFRLVKTINYPVNFAGVQTWRIGGSLPWQRWADSEIMLRCAVTAANHANTSDWDEVSVYLGAGEETVYGRQPNVADALVDA